MARPKSTQELLSRQEPFPIPGNDPTNRGRKNVDKETEREERFTRYAAKRVNAAIKALRLVRRMANRKSYGYTDEQAAKIVNALASECNKITEAFEKEDSGEESFSLT
jgi:hypothetical protein